MNKSALVAITIFTVLLPVARVYGDEIAVNVTIDDSLSITYEFANLNQTVYEQALVEFTPERIPETIVENFEKGNQTLRWGPGASPLESDNTTHTIRNSFFLSGSSITSFSLNKTTLRRIYEVKTDWRKIKVNLTSSYSVDFAQRLAKPVSEWQKPNATTFFHESKETSAPDILFYIVLPASASAVQAEGDTILYEGQPYFEDQLLNSPFLVLIALIVAVTIIFVYRKAR